jgi:hypothetical protein
LFSGCDHTGDFFLQDASAAYNASFALLDQVFLDISITEQFDFDATLTLGCDFARACTVFTPYIIGINPNMFGVFHARHFAAYKPSCQIREYEFSTTSDLRSSIGNTFPIWSVPEPSTLFLFNAGLLAILRMHGVGIKITKRLYRVGPYS